MEYNAEGFWKDSAGKGIRPYRFTHERVGGPPEMAEQLYRKRTRCVVGIMTRTSQASHSSM